MAIFQTAILADKFTGLSFIMFIIWMVPNIVVHRTNVDLDTEWAYIRQQQGNSNNNNIGVTDKIWNRIKIRYTRGLPHPDKHLLASPEEWLQVHGSYPSTVGIYLTTLRAYVNAIPVGGATSIRKRDDLILETAQLISTQVMNDDIEGTIVGSCPSVTVMTQGLWRISRDVTHRGLSSYTTISDGDRSRTTDVHQDLYRNLAMHVEVMPLPKHHKDGNSGANDDVGRISILCVDVSQEKDILQTNYFDELYDKLSVGGYVIVLNRDQKSANKKALIPIPPYNTIVMNRFDDSRPLYWRKEASDDFVVAAAPTNILDIDEEDDDADDVDTVDDESLRLPEPDSVVLFSE